MEQQIAFIIGMSFVTNVLMFFFLSKFFHYKQMFAWMVETLNSIGKNMNSISEFFDENVESFHMKANLNGKFPQEMYDKLSKIRQHMIESGEQEELKKVEVLMSLINMSHKKE